MHWTNFLGLFFAGAFAINAVPHTVQGVCGNRFQTPFAKPPGVGESSAVVNLVWGLANVAIAATLTGYSLPSETPPPPPWSLGIAFGCGAVAMGLFLARHFGRVRNAPPQP